MHAAKLFSEGCVFCHALKFIWRLKIWIVQHVFKRTRSSVYTLKQEWINETNITMSHSKIWNYYSLLTTSIVTLVMFSCNKVLDHASLFETRANPRVSGCSNPIPVSPILHCFIYFLWYEILSVQSFSIF